MICFTIPMMHWKSSTNYPHLILFQLKVVTIGNSHFGVRNLLEPKPLWKESLNSDGQQFHQYQQNKQLVLILNHWQTQRQKRLPHINIYTDRNPGPCLGQAQQMRKGDEKQLMEFRPSPLDGCTSNVIQISTGSANGCSLLTTSQESRICLLNSITLWKKIHNWYIVFICFILADLTSICDKHVKY